MTPASSIPARPIWGAVIAGGESRRFGSDKAVALLNGQPLIEHAIAALRPWVTEMMVCGRDWDGLRHLPDAPVAGMGPLGGIAAALAHAKAQRVDWVLTIGCDMPDVPADLMAALIARRPSYCGDAPILGCWPGSAAPMLLDRLRDIATAIPPAGSKEGRLSVRRWAGAIGAHPVPAPVPLANINTPTDLASR